MEIMFVIVLAVAFLLIAHISIELVTLKKKYDDICVKFFDGVDPDSGFAKKSVDNMETME